MTDSPSAGRRHNRTEALALIDDLLTEQGELSAVETFSRAHDTHVASGRTYRHLLPATAPTVGQQYAFEVDLDRCSGCKACVSACHSLNGLDDQETWREVGLLVGDHAADLRARRGALAFQQHVTTACHHCVDPACLNGCPVLAYDKDPLTGIVRHLDDQCIGCQYCVMMCPYEVPQYSGARGIVRKCDMCSSRLAAGETTACAQACPTSAIRITIVDQAKVRGKYRPLRTFRSLSVSGAASSDNQFLPASPNPAITLPTTRFVTRRALERNLFAGDHATARPAEPHSPLILLLVLSQQAVGASLGALFVKPERPLLVAALIISLLAISAGTLHLGQPLKAWRSFLGWRKSWFSRELIAICIFLILLAGSAVTRRSLLLGVGAIAGLFTVTCSAMIYVDTRREFWSAARTFPKFFGTTLQLGFAAVFVALAWEGSAPNEFLAASMMLAGCTLTKLVFEHRIFVHLVDAEKPAQTPLNKTARLLAGELNGIVRIRIVCGLLGGVLLPLAACLRGGSETAGLAPLAIGVFGLCLLGELLERYLFFTAVVSQKMPGGVTA